MEKVYNIFEYFAIGVYVNLLQLIIVKVYLLRLIIIDSAICSCI